MTTTIPLVLASHKAHCHKPLGRGILQAIIRDTGLTVEEFVRYLKS